MNFVAVQALISYFCLVLHYDKAGTSMYKPSQSTQATLSLFFLYMSMLAFPCWETVSAASILWVWACPNDWQVSSNSCKSGSGTRVEPLHLSCWIHICTAHTTNYNSPSVCMCVLCALKYFEYICTMAINYCYFFRWNLKQLQICVLLRNKQVCLYCLLKKISTRHI